MKAKTELQDIEAWIKIIRKGKSNKLHYVLNRLAVPSYLFKSDDEWLEGLLFLKKQKIEQIKFFNKLRKKYRG